MSSLSVALPLRYSTTDGYEMNKSIKDVLKQNLKMLVLTNPGERVMDRDWETYFVYLTKIIIILLFHRVDRSH